MPKKIFIDAHMFDHGYEGSATFIRGLYLALVTKYPNKYQIYLGCKNSTAVLKAFDNHPSFSIALYKFDNRYLRLLFDIPRLINEISPDIAHFQYFTPLIKNCKWHVTIHDVIFNDYPQYFSKKYIWFRNIFFRISDLRADLLSTVSEYSKERIAYWYELKLSSLNVIPNAVVHVDKSKLSSKSDLINNFISNSKSYFLCVSRFEPRKNQICLLQAFVHGKYWLKGISLIFVGDKTLDVLDFDSAWKAIPEEARSYIYLLSGISYSDMQLLYAHALAAIYPSFAEGFGIPPLEAAIHGTPSLCSKTTAMKEFEFPYSFFFDPNCPNSLEVAINQILENPDRAKAKALDARNMVRLKYRWENSADKLHTFLSNVL